MGGDRWRSPNLSLSNPPLGRRGKRTPRRGQGWGMRTLTEAASEIRCSGISAQPEGPWGRGLQAKALIGQRLAEPL